MSNDAHKQVVCFFAQKLCKAKVTAAGTTETGLVLQIVRLVRGQSSEGYGLPADVWAVGVTAYMVLVGAGPFEAASKQGTYDKIRSAQPYIPSHLSSAAKSFVAQV